MALLAKEIIEDHEELASWIVENPNVSVKVRNHELSVDFNGLSLRQADFYQCTLLDPDFRNASLDFATFRKSTLRRGEWDGARIRGAKFTSATIIDVDFQGVADWREVEFTSAIVHGSDFSEQDLHEAALSDARFYKTKFVGTSLAGADLRRAEFCECDFSAANLTGADLSHTTWHGCMIDSKTNVAGATWSAEHDSPNDGSDQLDIPLLRRLFNWKVIRFLARLPLFSGSYVLLALALAVATGIDWINESPLMSSAEQSLSFPPRLRLVLVGSAALAMGTTLFEVACPARVKERSRSAWVDDLRRPGLLYEVESFKNPTLNVLSVVLTLIGVVLLTVLFLERFWATFEMIMTL